MNLYPYIFKLITNVKRIFFFFLSGLFCLSSYCQKEDRYLETAKLLSRDILTQTGYCSDGSDRARNGEPRFSGAMEAKTISFKGYIYVTYYEANGDIIIARKKQTQEATWEKSVLKGYQVKSQDRHNKIAIAISKGDGVIHLSFDHHNSPVLNYAHSAIGVALHPKKVVWDNSIFILQPNLGLKDDVGLVTYPSFTSIEKSGNLILYWRSGGAIKGEMNLARYNSTDHSWSIVGMISSREGKYKGVVGKRGPYPAGVKQDSTGTLHLAWLWREDLTDRDILDVKGNHGLYYAQSTDEGFTWHNSEGKLVASISSGLKMGVDNIGPPPVEIPMVSNPSNVGISSAINPYNQDFYLSVKHYNDDFSKHTNFLYKRTVDGKWTAQPTQMEGNCKIVFNDDFMFRLYESEILYATRDTDYTDWKKIELPNKLEKGKVNWNTDSIDEGMVSLAIQYDPITKGKATPIEFMVFQLINK